MKHLFISFLMSLVLTIASSAQEMTVSTSTSTTPTVSGSQVEKFTVNGITFEMVWIEAGTFMMGATREMMNPWDNEKPAHQVTLTNAYYLGMRLALSE